MKPIPADEVFARTMTKEMIEESDRRAKILIEEYETLQKLRQARKLTQEKMARKLGKRQVSIAQMEKRSDVLLSTLREYVEALGGELELIVRFGDGRPVLLSGISENSLPLEKNGSK